MWHIYSRKYYETMRKKDMLPFATTWMDLEGLTLSKMSQRITNTLYLSYIDNINKQTKMQFTENKLVLVRGGVEMCVKWVCTWQSLSCVLLPVTPWTTAHQASPPMGFSRQEYWTGLPFPSPGELWPRDRPHCKQTLNCLSHRGSHGEKLVKKSKVTTYSYKINKSWECNVQHGNYS